MKKKNIFIFILMIGLLFTTTVSYAFTDTYGNWAISYINWATDNGYLKGDPDGKFRPDDSISNAEFYTIVNRMTKDAKSAYISFSDVSKGDWYYDEISVAVGSGYIKNSDGKIYPNEKITRGEVARIMAFVYGLENDEYTARKYYDYNLFSENNQGAIGALTKKGVLDGYYENNNFSFKPDNNIKRSEVAKVIKTAFDRLGRPQNAENAKIVNGKVLYNGRYYDIEEFSRLYGKNFEKFPKSENKTRFVVNVADRSGRRIGGAKITLKNYEKSETTYSGYGIDLPNGLYDMVIEYSGFETYYAQVNLSGIDQNIDITLLPEGYEYGKNVQGQHGYYGYEPIGSRIKVVYVDEDGVEIISPKFIKGDIGEKIYADAEEIPGYELLSSKEKTPIISGDNDLDTVEFRYKKSFR